MYSDRFTLSPTPSRHPPNSVSSSLCDIHQVLLVFSCACGHSLECGQTVGSHPLQENCPPPLLPEAIIASSSLTKGGTSHLPPCCMLGFCLVWGCARLVHTVTTVMSSYTQLPCPVWEKHEVTERSNKKTVFPGSFWSNWSRCSVSSALHTAIEEHRSSELSSSCCAQTHFNFLIKEFSHFADTTTEGICDSAIRHLTVTGPSPVLTAPEVRTFQSFFLFGAL